MTKKCKTCGLDKLIPEDFAPTQNYKGKQYYSSYCHDCDRLRTEVYRRQNPAKVKESQRKYDSIHKAERREGTRQWRLANPDKAQAAVIRWKNAHRERVQALARLDQGRRRARIVGAPGRATIEQVKGRKEVWGNRCWICGGCATAIDHVIPLSRGGSNWPANLRPICTSCNSKKANRLPFAWPVTRAALRRRVRPLPI